jgi:hypothetical protein
LLPDLLLTGMIVGHRERHQLVQRHAVAGVYVEEFRGHRCELQPLLHDGRAYEEPGGDVLFAQSLVAQVWKARNWSSECRASRWTFSASESSSATPPVLTMQGTG